MASMIFRAALGHFGAPRSGRTALCVAALLSSACTVSSSQSGGTADTQVFVTESSDRSWELWADPGANLLTAVDEVAELDASVRPTGNFVRGNLLAEAGAYYEAMTLYHPFEIVWEEETDQCEGSQLPDAVPTICDAIDEPTEAELERALAMLEEGEELAPENQVMMISDVPNLPRLRSLGLEILQCVWDAGYRFLAVEALEESGEALMERGYVSRTESGPFLREPRLARMIHEAMEIGFTIVGFPVENRCERCNYVDAIRRHSAEQYASLIEQTMLDAVPASEDEPLPKALVWTLPRQVYKEVWSEDEVLSLAGHLLAESGLDPYSLDQIILNPRVDYGPVPESGIQIATGPNGSCGGSYSEETPTDRPLYNGMVIHKAPEREAGRWLWLNAPEAERLLVEPVCLADSCSDDRVLVELYPTGVDIGDRVPLDRAVCDVGGRCELVYPGGEYQVLVWGSSAQRASLPAAELSPGQALTVEI